ncbi:MAG TPA: SRPBCC family protein, partial [Chloroflexia bacterium]|nr:SRPBCC family protein [Chloroflexia bacterium]
MRVEKDVTINAPIDKVYEMWTDFENFPRFMKHVESVKRSGENQ